MAYSLEWMESKTKQYALHALPTQYPPPQRPSKLSGSDNYVLSLR